VTRTRPREQAHSRSFAEAVTDRACGRGGCWDARDAQAQSICPRQFRGGRPRVRVVCRIAGRQRQFRGNISRGLDSVSAWNEGRGRLKMLSSALGGVWPYRTAAASRQSFRTSSRMVILRPADLCAHGSRGRVPHRCQSEPSDAGLPQGLLDSVHPRIRHPRSNP